MGQNRETEKVDIKEGQRKIAAKGVITYERQREILGSTK
jgi:hypothetical protein